MTRNRRAWTQAEDETLRNLWATSTSISDIARQLRRWHGPTVLRAEKLNLSSRKKEPRLKEVSKKVLSVLKPDDWTNLDDLYLIWGEASPNKLKAVLTKLKRQGCYIVFRLKKGVYFRKETK